MYFALESDKHILSSQLTQLNSEGNEPLEREGNTDQEGKSGFSEEDGPADGLHSPSTRESTSSGETKTPPVTQSPPNAQAEFNIKKWVNKSIPLTFESGGGAADSIKQQYRYVVRDLKNVQQLLLQNQPDSASSLIRPMLWDRSNIYREDAEWYQILTLLASGDRKSGLERLNRLTKDNIHLYYFLGQELHAELVPISSRIQNRSDGQSKKEDKKPTGY